MYQQMRKKEKQLLSALLITIFVQVIAVTSLNAQEKPLNLKDAIEMALANNRTLRSDSLGIAATQYKNKELAGSFLPQINYSNSIESNIAIASQMVPGAMVNQPSKELVPVQFGTRYGMRTGIEVNQIIYRKDLSVKNKAADLYSGIAKTKYSLSREELVYQVSASYFSMQSVFELVQSTTHDYKNISEVLQVAKAQYEQGTLKKIDYQALQINLANKQSQLDQYRTRYSEQLAYFNYLLGLPADAETVIDTDYSNAGNLLAPGNEVASRMDIKLYQQTIQSKMVDLKSIHAEKLPVINSYFRFNVNSQFNELSKTFDGDYRYKASSVGISVSMPIFDGNRRKNRMQATKIQLDQLKMESDQLHDKAKMELVKTSQTFSNNKQQLSINKENLVLAEKVFESRKALYTQGVTTLIELLDAERELSQARTNYTQAVIDVQKGWMDVHKANGTLLTNFINSL
jgi:outer membrane protein